MSHRYVVTTPIYYPNSVPHVGTALTTLLADITARYHRMLGESVFFLTGTDENGLKLKEAAEKNGSEVGEFVTRISNEFRKVWDQLGIEPDDFIRTTEPRHIACVQAFFTELQRNDFVYKDLYEGWYDVSTETFFKESELIDGKSPDGNEVRLVKEENYFFRLSAFQERLLTHIESHPDFLIPNNRKNEVVSFIKQGLRDVCISRLNPGWGIEVPGDPERVIYVWFDAVINYLTPTGWPNAGWEELWPADVHWMAKDIFTRFHATLWPAMLMGVGLPLPKHIVGHAYLLINDEKISKTKGNVIPPMELAQELVKISGATFEMAVDAVRYGLAAVTPFENDTGFGREEFFRRFNSDLANDLGNALHRSLSMSHKFVDGVVPGGEIEPEMAIAIAKAKVDYSNAMAGFRIDEASDAMIDLIRFLNKYIDTRAPWGLAKTADPALSPVMRSMLLCLRTVEGLVRPIMPKGSMAIAQQLNLPNLSQFDEIGLESSLPAGTKLGLPQPLFPRIDIKAWQIAHALEIANATKLAPETPAPNDKKMNTNAPDLEKVAPPLGDEISIEEFMKVKLRIARIIEAEPLADSDKLMKLQVAIGDEKRQIVAGIRKSYSAEDLIGRQIVVVANLKPAKLRGAESQGMLLAATDNEGLAILLMPEREAPEGAGVK